MQPTFSPGELAFLVMVITAFVLFVATLFACQVDYWRWIGRRAEGSRHLADALPHAI